MTSMGADRLGQVTKGKRKFIIALLCWAGATAGLLLSKLDGGAYVAALGLVMGLYGAANVGAKATDKMKGK
jgi:hypothetical protein